MDQAQTRALAALEPFILLATTTKSPSHRFLADLITRATSAQGTYIFTELLQTAAIQSLRSPDTPPESAAYLTLLEVFSYGTYEEYKSELCATSLQLGLILMKCKGTPNLPTLTPVQETKLRQLTILSLASSSTPLTYSNLLTSLSLPSAAALEALITQSIYASLLTARLSPASNPPLIHITSVAPLRDLRPLSLPEYANVLAVWQSRCDSVINNLEENIKSIRNQAAARKQLSRKRQDVVDQAVLTKAEQEEGKVTASGMSLRAKGKGSGNKRDLEEHMAEGEEDDFEDASEEGNGGMEIDDGAVPIGGVGMGRSSKKRGARNGR